MRRWSFVLAAFAALGTAASSQAAEKLGLKKGDVKLQSVGPIAFSPDSVLFVSDPKAATVYAIDTGESPGKRPFAEVKASGLEKQAKELGGENAKVVDIAVNPQSGSVFVSISGATPTIAKLTNGKLAKVSLEGVANASSLLPNPPEDKETPGQNGRPGRNPRNDSITDIAYVDGHVIASGSSKTGSSVQDLPYPFGQKNEVAALEIYHAAHGKLEDGSPIRAFVPFNINGQPHLLAGFQCTPLVKFPISAVDDGQKIKGTTVAELGNRNQPLDMVAYEKDGENFLLIANTARGVMKVSTKDIDKNPGLTEPVRGGGTAGQTFEKIDELTGTVQLDKLDDSRAVVVIDTQGELTLKTVALP
ncbi:MAG TPA: hypothetical protein VM510_16840 [Caulifigura sp.]|nr:hypothetical protein [Caulifigura sp.]